MEAAARFGAKVKKLAIYEAPYNSDEAARKQWMEYRKDLAKAPAENRRGDAVVLFMTSVVSPALVMNGTVIPFMHETATALVQAIPHSQHCTLEGQPHDVDLKVLAPVLMEFFAE